MMKTIIVVLIALLVMVSICTGGVIAESVPF